MPGAGWVLSGFERVHVEMFAHLYVHHKLLEDCLLSTTETKGQAAANTS